jgi:hypothetical protein
MINDLELEEPDDLDFDETRTELSELWRDLQGRDRLPWDDYYREY